ncbi:MAG: hypothetical protein V2A73_02500 [Pseudomonadota bacterium]
MRSYMLLGVLIVGVGVACSGKKSSSSSSPAQQQAAALPSTVTADASTANRQPPPRRVLAPIAVDEVGGLLVGPEGSRNVKPVQKAPMGERIEAAFCMDAGEVPALAEQLKQKLTAAGWQAVFTRANPTNPERFGVSAQKQPYMLTGVIQRGNWPDCVADKGQTYIALGVHKLDLSGVITGGQPGVAGPMIPPGHPAIQYQPPGVPPIQPNMIPQPGHHHPAAGHPDPATGTGAPAPAGGAATPATPKL